VEKKESSPETESTKSEKLCPYMSESNYDQLYDPFDPARFQRDNYIDYYWQDIIQGTFNSSRACSFDQNPSKARFFVIKSNSEADVHKAIKFGIWSSTSVGNSRLNAAFTEFKGEGPIYLFFSVNKSGRFCGLAQLMTPVEDDCEFEHWTDKGRYIGQMKLDWIFVKDIRFKFFVGLKNQLNEGKDVFHSRDTQEISFDEGVSMIQLFVRFREKTSIFNDFPYYERKMAE